MKSSKAITSGLWFTVSNFLVKSIGLITTPIFTRLMTKAEFGDFRNFTSWTSIVLVVTSLNLEASLIRARFDHEKDLGGYAKSMIALSSLSTLLWFLIISILQRFATEALSMDYRYICAMFLYLLFYPVINIIQNLERFQYKYKLTVAISVSVAISTSLLSVVLVSLLQDKLAGRVAGYVLPVVIIGIILLLIVFSHQGKINIKYWKYALPFTLPFIPHLLSMTLLSGMDQVMIKKYCGAEDLALYGLAYTCASILSILVTSINSAYSPWLGEKLSQNKHEDIKKVSLPYVALFWYVAGGMLLVIPEVLLILGGTPYMEARYVMPPVAASCVLQLIYCMYVNVEQYEKKTGRMAVASVIAMLSNYILNSIFIPQYGYIAAAYTTYASYFILMILHICIVRKIGMAGVYKNKEIIIMALASCVLAIASNLLLEKTTLRFCILALYIIFGGIILNHNKDLIMQFIRRKA